MGLAGGLLSLFGVNPGPSNQDILNAVNKGFADVELDLEDVKAGLDRIQRTLGVIQSEVEEILQDVDYGKTVFRDIDAGFTEYMTRLQAFQQQPTASNYRYMTDYVSSFVTSYSKDAFEYFSSENVGKYLASVLTQRGPYVAAMQFQVVHATRHKLFGFLLHNDIFRNKNISADGLEYSRNLYADFGCYEKVLEQLGLTDLVSKLHDAALNSCEAQRQTICAHRGDRTLNPLDLAVQLDKMVQNCGRWGCEFAADEVRNVMQGLCSDKGGDAATTVICFTIFQYYWELPCVRDKPQHFKELLGFSPATTPPLPEQLFV